MRELLVLWDIDGTLVTAPGLGDRLYREVFRTLFGRELEPIALKAGRTDRAIVLETLALAGVPSPASHVDAFLATLGRRNQALTGAGGPGGLDGDRVARALPGAADALAALVAIDPAVSGVRVRQSVLTGNVRPGAEFKLRYTGLADHLDLDIGAYGDRHEVRAELVGLARAAASASYAPAPSVPGGSPYAGQSTVLVGDTPLDVAAALATGARVVGVATGGYSPGDLAAAGAHAILPDLTDTAAVVAAITQPPAPDTKR